MKTLKGLAPGKYVDLHGDVWDVVPVFRRKTGGRKTHMANVARRTGHGCLTIFDLPLADWLAAEMQPCDP